MEFVLSNMEGLEGVTTRRNKNNFVAVRLHYTAVPAFRTEEWRKKAYSGYLTKEQWEQEMEINFTLAGTSKIYPMFDYQKHVRKLGAIKELPLLVGWDYGYHHPAVVIAQIDTYDTLCVLDELLGSDITIQKFTKRAKEYLERNYPHHYKSKYIYHYGDPAGNQQNDKSEFTSIQIQRKMGVFVRWKRVGVKQGVRIIQQLMLEREDKSLGFKIDPQCKILIDGFQGGYTEDVPRNERASKEMPFEDDYYSHNQDGLRYIVVNKYPAHGILFRGNKRQFTTRMKSPLSDDDDNIDRQGSVTGYR